MNVTMETTLEEILRQPQLAGKEYMIDPAMDALLEDLLGDTYNTVFHERNFTQLTLKEIKEIVPAWNLDSMRAGLQFLLEKAVEKNVFYDIWSEKEVEEDPSKKNTGIAAFTLPENKKFALVCPGGGYASVCSIAEGYPLAMKMNELGYAAFVLKYRVGQDARWGKPMDDLAQAVKYIHDHRGEFHVDVEDYVLIGFSAGGHLAASFGTESIGSQYYKLPEPGAIFLGYPVITMGDKTHAGSREMLFGIEHIDDMEMQDKYSLEKQVTASYPVSYVWQCEEDETVPVENSKLFVESLRKNNVPYKYEVFPGSAHGWGLGIGTDSDGWIERAVRFWKSLSGKNQKQF